MELLQKVHARNIVEWAKDKPEVVVYSADLTSSCEADLFRDTYPDRFFSMGLTEQNMLSMAGGMARDGRQRLWAGPRGSGARSRSVIERWITRSQPE